MQAVEAPEKAAKELAGSRPIASGSGAIPSALSSAGRTWSKVKSCAVDSATPREMENAQGSQRDSRSRCADEELSYLNIDIRPIIRSLPEKKKQILRNLTTSSTTRYQNVHG